MKGLWHPLVEKLPQEMALRGEKAETIPTLTEASQSVKKWDEDAYLFKRLEGIMQCLHKGQMIRISYELLPGD